MTDHEVLSISEPYRSRSEEKENIFEVRSGRGGAAVFGAPSPLQV